MKSLKIIIINLLMVFLASILNWNFFCGEEIIYTFPKTENGNYVNIGRSGRTTYLFGIEDRYILTIGPKGKLDGHSIDISLLNYDGGDIKIYLKKCVVSESSAGISFTQPTGHIIFIPQKAYSGGR